LVYRGDIKNMVEKEGFNLFKAMAYIDRKYLFLMVFIITIGSLLFPISIPIQIGTNTNLYYSYLSKLKSTDIVIWKGATFRSYMEVKSGYIATLRVIIEKGAKLVAMYDEGDQQSVFQMVMGNPSTGASGILTSLMEQKNYKYWDNYIDLGMVLLGGEAAYVSLARNFQGYIHNDYAGRPIQGSFLENVNGAADFAMIIDSGPLAGIGGDFLGRHFAMDYKVVYLGNMIGVGIAPTQTYIETGIVKGMLESGRGGAELEYLIGAPGPGLAALNVMTLGHYYFIALIIIGNIGYFGWERKARREEKIRAGGQKK
jgi:hypothetical protein